MPIIQIELVVEDDERPVKPATLQALADQLGLHFGTEQGGTWVSLGYTNRSNYCENGSPDLTIRPAIVRILQYQRPPGDQLRAEAAELTGLIASQLNWPPENTHLIFEPDGQGRVAFGGLLAQ